jgi:hypothetical protein
MNNSSLNFQESRGNLFERGRRFRRNKGKVAIAASAEEISKDKAATVGSAARRRAHPPNHIAKNQKATATAIATAAAKAYGNQSRCISTWVWMT